MLKTTKVLIKTLLISLLVIGVFSAEKLSENNWTLLEFTPEVEVLQEFNLSYDNKAEDPVRFIQFSPNYPLEKLEFKLTSSTHPTINTDGDIVKPKITEAATIEMKLSVKLKAKSFILDASLKILVIISTAKATFEAPHNFYIEQRFYEDPAALTQVGNVITLNVNQKKKFPENTDLEFIIASDLANVDDIEYITEGKSTTITKANRLSIKAAEIPSQIKITGKFDSKNLEYILRSVDKFITSSPVSNRNYSYGRSYQEFKSEAEVKVYYMFKAVESKNNLSRVSLMTRLSMDVEATISVNFQESATSTLPTSFRASTKNGNEYILDYVPKGNLFVFVEIIVSKYTNTVSFIDVFSTTDMGFFNGEQVSLKHNLGSNNVLCIQIGDKLNPIQNDYFFDYLGSKSVVVQVTESFQGLFVEKTKLVNSVQKLTLMDKQNLGFLSVNTNLQKNIYAYIYFKDNVNGEVNINMKFNEKSHNIKDIMVKSNALTEDHVVDKTTVITAHFVEDASEYVVYPTLINGNAKVTIDGTEIKIGEAFVQSKASDNQIKIENLNDGKEETKGLKSVVRLLTSNVINFNSNPSTLNNDNNLNFQNVFKVDKSINSLTLNFKITGPFNYSVTKIKGETNDKLADDSKNYFFDGTGTKKNFLLRGQAIVGKITTDRVEGKTTTEAFEFRNLVGEEIFQISCWNDINEKTDNFIITKVDKLVNGNFPVSSETKRSILAFNLETLNGNEKFLNLFFTYDSNLGFNGMCPYVLINPSENLNEVKSLTAENLANCYDNYGNSMYLSLTNFNGIKFDPKVKGYLIVDLNNKFGSSGDKFGFVIKMGKYYNINDNLNRIDLDRGTDINISVLRLTPCTGCVSYISLYFDNSKIPLEVFYSNTSTKILNESQLLVKLYSTSTTATIVNLAETPEAKDKPMSIYVNVSRPKADVTLDQSPIQNVFTHELKDNLSKISWKPLQEGEYAFVTKTYVIPFNKNELINEKTISSMFNVFDKKELLYESNALKQNVSELDNIVLNNVPKGIYNLFVVSEYKDYGYSRFFVPQVKQAVNFVKQTIDLTGGVYSLLSYKNSPTMPSEQFFYKFASSKADPIVGLQIVPRISGLKISTESENAKLVSKDKSLILFDLEQKEDTLNVEFSITIESTDEKYVEDENITIVPITKSNKYTLGETLKNKIHSLTHFGAENKVDYIVKSASSKLCDVQVKTGDNVTKITYKDKDTEHVITDFGANKTAVFTFINEEGIKNGEFTVFTQLKGDNKFFFLYHCYEEVFRYHKIVNVEDANNESGLKVHSLLAKDTFRFIYSLKDFIGGDKHPIFNTQAMYIKPVTFDDSPKLSAKLLLVKVTEEAKEDVFPKDKSAFPYDAKSGLTIISRTTDNSDLGKVFVTVEVTGELTNWNFKILFSARPKEITSFDFKKEVKDLVAYKNSINNICVSNLEGQYLANKGASNLYITKLGEYNLDLALSYGNVEFFSESLQANVEPEAVFNFVGNQVNHYSVNYSEFMKNKVFCFSYKYNYFQTAFPSERINLVVNSILSDREYYTIPKNKYFSEFSLDLNIESSSHVRIPYSNYAELIGSEFIMYDNNLTDVLSYSLKQNREYKDVDDLFVEDSPVKLNTNFGVLTMDQTKNPNQDIVVHVTPKTKEGLRTLSQFYFVTLNSKSSETYKLNDVFAFKFSKSETKQKFSFSFDADENFGILITYISGTGKVTYTRQEGDKAVEKVIAEKETVAEIRTRTEAKKEVFDILCEQTDDKTSYVLVRTFSNNKETIPIPPEPTPDPPKLLADEEEFLNVFIKLNNPEVIKNFENSMIRYLVSSNQCRVSGFAYHISNSIEFGNVQDFPTEKQLRLTGIRSGRSKSFFVKFDKLSQVAQFANLTDKDIFLTMRLKMFKDKTQTDLLYTNSYLNEIPTLSFDSLDVSKLNLKDLIGDFQFKMNTKDAKESNRYFVLNLHKQNSSNVTFTSIDNKITTNMDSFDFTKVITLQSKQTEASFAVFATNNNLAILASESDSETLVYPEFNLNSSLSFDEKTNTFKWTDGIQNYDKLKNPNVEFELYLVSGINTPKNLPLYEFYSGEVTGKPLKTLSKETTTVAVEPLGSGVYTAFLVQKEKTTRISHMYNLANRLTFDLERIHLEQTGKVYSALFGVTHKSEQDEKEIVKLRVLVELDTSKLEKLNSLQISFSETVEYMKYQFTYDIESSTFDLITNDNTGPAIIDLSKMTSGLHDFLITIETERAINSELILQMMLFDDKPTIKMDANVLYENYYFQNFNVPESKEKLINLDFNDQLQASEHCQVQLAYDNEKIEKVSYKYENEKKELVEKVLEKKVGKTLLAGFKSKRVEGDLPLPVDGKITILKKQGDSDLLFGVLAVLHCANKGQNYYNYFENNSYVRVSNLVEETHYNFIYNVAPFADLKSTINRIQGFLLSLVDGEKVVATAFAEFIDAKEIKDDTFPRTNENSSFRLGKIENRSNELEFLPDLEKPTAQTLVFTVNVKPKETPAISLKEEDIARYNHSYVINFSNRVQKINSLKDFENKNVELNSHAYTIFELSDFDELVNNDLLALYLGTENKNVVLYVSYQFHGFDVNFYDKNSSDESDFKFESANSNFFLVNVHEHKMFYSVDQQISHADGLFFYFHLESDFKKQKQETTKFQARWSYDDLYLVNHANSDVKVVDKSRNLDLNLFLLKEQSARVLFDFSNIDHSLNDEYYVYTSHEAKLVKEGEGEQAKEVMHYNVNLSYNNSEAGGKIDKDSNLNNLFFPSEGFKSLDANGIVKLSDLLNKSKTALIKVENNILLNNEYSVYTNLNFSKLLYQKGEALSSIEFDRTYAVKLNKENKEFVFQFETDSKYRAKIEYPQGTIDKVGVQINTEPADEILKNLPKKPIFITNVEGKETVKLSLMAKEEEVDAYSIVLITFSKPAPEFIYVEKNKDLEKEEGSTLYLSIKLKELNENLSILQNSIYFQHETFGIKSFSYALEYNPSEYLTYKDLPSPSEKIVRKRRDGSVAAGLVNFSMLANEYKAETEVYLNIVVEKIPTDRVYVPFLLHHRKDKILRVSESENDYKSRSISQYNDDRFFLFMDSPNDKKYLMNVAIDIQGNSGKIYFKNCIGKSETCKFEQIDQDFKSFFNTYKQNYKSITSDRLPIRGIFEFRVLFNENSPNTVFVNLVRNAEFAEDYETAAKPLPIEVKQSEADNGQIKVELNWKVAMTAKSKETKPQPDLTYELFYVKLKLGNETQDREYYAYHMLEGKKFTTENNLCQTPTTSCTGLLPNGQYDLYLVAFERNTGKYVSFDVSKSLILSNAMKANDLSTISLTSDEDYTIFYHFKINKNQEYWFNLSSVDQATSNTSLKVFSRKHRNTYIFELDNGTKLQRGKFLTEEKYDIEDEYVVEIHAFVKDTRETTDLNFYNSKFEKEDERVAKVNLSASSKFSYSNMKDFQKVVINLNSMSSFLLNLQQQDYLIKSIDVLNDKNAVVKTYNAEEISSKNTDLTFTPPALKISEATTPINFSLIINLDETKVAKEVAEEKLISLFILDVSKNGAYQVVEFKNLVKRGLSKLFLGLEFRAKDTIRLIADLSDYKYKSDTEIAIDSIIGFLKLSDELVNVRAKFVAKPTDLSLIKEADFPLISAEASKEVFVNNERGLSFRKNKDLAILLLTIEFLDKDAKTFNNFSIQLYDAPRYIKVEKADNIYSLDVTLDFNSPQVAFIPTDISFMDIGDFLVYSHNEEFQLVFSYGEIPFSRDSSFSNIANYENFVDFSSTKLTRVMIDDNKIFKKEELFMTVFANKSKNAVKGKIEFKLTNRRFTLANTNSLIYSNINILKGNTSYTYVQNNSKSDVKDTFVLNLDKLAGNGVLKYKVVNKHESKYDSLEALFNFEGEDIISVDSGFTEVELENTKDVLVEVTTPNNNFLGELFFGKYLERFIANQNVFTINVGSVNFFKMTEKNEGSLRIEKNSETEQMGLLFTQMGGKGTTEFTIGESKVTTNNEEDNQKRLTSTAAKACNISFSNKEGDDKFRIVRVFSSFGMKVGDNLVKPNERVTVKIADLSKTTNVLVKFKQEYENNYIVLETPPQFLFEKVNYDIFSEFQSYDQEKNVLFASPEKALKETSEFQGESYLSIKIPPTQMAGFVLLVVKLRNNKKPESARALLNRQIFKLRDEESNSFVVSHYEEKDNAKLENKTPVELSYQFTNVRTLQIKNSPDVSLLSLNLYLNEEKPFNCQFNFKDEEMTKHSFTVDNEVRKNLFIQHNSKLEHFHLDLRCLRGFENSMFAIINFVDTSYSNYDYSLKNTDYSLELYSTTEAQVDGVKVKQTKVTVNTKESFVPKLATSVQYYVAYSSDKPEASLSVFKFLKNDKNFTIAKVTENRFSLDGFDYEKNFHTRLFAHEVNSGRVVAYKDYTYNQLKYGSSWWVILLIILAVLIFIGIIVIVVHNVMKNRRMQSEELNRNLLSEDNNRNSVNDP